MKDYKITLNLPETKFKMRGDLVKTEPKTLQRWYNDNLYRIIRNIKKGKKLFILHDGPPYANGLLHIGHAVNKVLKDIIIKSKGMAGFDSPYIPGWDCHGLPIELKVEQKLGKPGSKISHTDFRKACRHYANQQILLQKKDFIRMGVLGDWENPYLTMNFHTEANIIRVLSHIIANGYLIQGYKPVYWCINCCSALSDAEVEHFNKHSLSIDVAFQAVNLNEVKNKFRSRDVHGPISVLIWTTTPWTLPANKAIAINAKIHYQLVQIEDQALIIAKDLITTVMNRIKITSWTILGEVLGESLEFLKFYHPFLNLEIPIILGEHVTLDTGTGAVHTAPAHGIEDYLVCKKYDIKIANIIEANGYYKSGISPYLDGIKIFEAANKVIINLLKKSGVLLHIDYIEHNYPHCWRHKTPIIFHTTKQWFINMDHKKLRHKLIEEINKIQWIPDWGKKRITSMVATRPDWCVSRQRTWGVPMSLFIHKDNGDLHPNTLWLMEQVAKRVELHGIQAWWDLNLKNFIFEDSENYVKVLDTLDVWFDAGSTSIYSIMNMPSELRKHSIDMFLEGSDQHRGWFMSSLIISVALQDKAPCRKILTHGFTVDNYGRKMSKSIGNAISPQDIMEKYGSDILRLWIASTDYSREITVSEEVINRSVDMYRRIRNTARFLLANLKGFNPKIDLVTPEEMIVIDRWALRRTKYRQKNIIFAYENCDFHTVIKNLMEFCSVEMGSFYLDIIKDRQYTFKIKSLAHRSCQTVMFYIIEAMVRWIAPIISFTADEIWRFIPGDRSPYIFTEEWFDGLFDLKSDELMNDAFWNDLLKVRREINKAIELARANKKIKGSLEGAVILYARGSIADKLKSLGEELKFILLTSTAKVVNYALAPQEAQQSSNLHNLKFLLYRADGKKCSRCWHYCTDIGKFMDYPEICGRCVMNLVGKGEERHYV
ncbi:MAG: isoleucine--tRNA ligase [Candidatus Dasytiphilus stammeri]